MNSAIALDVTRDALTTAVLLSAPVLAVGLLVGLIVALVQAVTSVQDQTMAAIPKMLAIVGALLLLLPWMLTTLLEFTEGLFELMPELARG